MTQEENGRSSFLGPGGIAPGWFISVVGGYPGESDLQFAKPQRSLGVLLALKRTQHQSFHLKPTLSPHPETANLGSYSLLRDVSYCVPMFIRKEHG